MPVETETTAGATGLAGDHELVALFREHYTPMLRAAWLLLGDRSGSEDVVQEAFLRFHQASGRVREPDRAVSYLRSTVLNLARGRLRRVAVAERHAGTDSGVGMPLLPDEDAVRADDRRHVVAALRSLPDRQRECLVLRYYLDLPEREIAAALDISAGSVKTHVHRAMGALATALEDLR